VLGGDETMRGGSRPSVEQIVVWVVAGLAAIGAVWLLSDVLLVLFLAVLLACALRGATNAVVARTGLPGGLVLAGVVLLISAVGLGIAWWVVPHLAHEVPDLVTRLSTEFGEVSRWLGIAVPGVGGGGFPSLQALQGRLAQPVETMLGWSLQTTANVVLIAVTAIYLAAMPDTYVEGVLHLLPFRVRPRVRELMLRIAGMLRLWLLGQAIDMVAVGVLSGAGMLLLGVPAPFALGLLSALLTFIPYFGAILAGIPAIALALTVDWQTALWALGVYTLCHCIEGYLIAPIVQRRLVRLPPALTVMSMTVAGALFGLFGIAVGTPLAATGLLAVRMLYVEDVLQDHTVQDRI